MGDPTASLPALARPRRSAWAWLVVGAFAALVLWSARGTEVDVAGLLGSEGRHQMLAYVRRLFPPDLSATMLWDALAGALETFAISFVGSLLAVLIAFPLSVLTTRTLLYRGILYEGRRLGPWQEGLRVGLYALAKGTLNLLRTIPEIVWALIFVFLVGLGPFPGVLALGVHTAGVLGKLFGEVLEAVDAKPLEALQAMGASRVRILLYGILPQALPQCLAYALYRWEVNIRAAAVLGFVGAGGLGQRIYVAISLFLENQLLTLILAVYLMVTLVDALSAFLRHRLA
ncbi:MAG: phosphonate ABC transporter, permease protein PhnE [Candidatus Rokubacteria bacterium]|nr:phosphonate ABC transporter, permease protein PhnE [Candidatus Rokubacteria bacterium]